MGKKRKAGGRPFGRNESQDSGEADSKLRINTYEDVADSEDEFHINRDKILLEEGPAQKKQRKIEEEGNAPEFVRSIVSHINAFAEALLEPSDEEVFAFREDVFESEDDVDDALETSDISTGSKQRHRDEGLDSEASDAQEEDEDTGRWGTSKGDYYNADAIETEADALEEEAEARRLQQKHLQGMTEADFGFDETEWLKASRNREDEDANDSNNVIREVLPKVQISDAMSPEERLRILRTRYPEFEPLAQEFLSLQAVHEDSKAMAAAAVTAQQHLDAQSLATEMRDLPIAAVKHGALSAYLATVSMYFALLTCGEADSGGQLSAMPSEEIRDHSIMETLVECRDLWGRLRNVPVPELSIEDIPDVAGTNGHSTGSKNGEPGTLDATDNSEAKTADEPKRKKKKKSKAQKAAEAAQIKEDALRAERLRKTEEGFASLTALTAPSILSSRKPTRPAKTAAGDMDSDSDFGEQTALTSQEAAEKAQRKKSLRFYTSQIAQKANKRDAAGRDATGDADLPYRERLKDRQERLNAEAEARGKKPKTVTKGEALGSPSDEEEDHAAAEEVRNGSDSEDYYDFIVARSAQKKASKAALAAAHAQAEREGGIVRVVEEETADGKRAISYAIEKNKGLAPRRKKEVRNPRVKKRKKYEEKKKKLGSIRQIYKGGEGRGGYGGEKTGISTRLVKSVKL